MWLLEEPESFLHADIAMQLANLLSSAEWLQSIQMVISTHSPIILAASHHNSEKCRWVILKNGEMRSSKVVKDIQLEDIEGVGALMGDSNFDAYFAAASPGDSIFIEDTRPATIESFRRNKVPVTRALNGITEMKKYLAVITALPAPAKAKFYFIIDADSGMRDVKEYLTKANHARKHKGFHLYRIGKHTRLILLPPGEAAEDLFKEFNQVVEDIGSELFDDQLKLKANIPSRYTRAVADLRGKTFQSKAELFRALRKYQDIKDAFWQKHSKPIMHGEKRRAIQELLKPEAS